MYLIKTTEILNNFKKIRFQQFLIINNNILFTVPGLPQQPGYSQEQPGFPQQQNYSKNAPTLSAPPNYGYKSNLYTIITT